MSKSNKVTVSIVIFGAFMFFTTLLTGPLASAQEKTKVVIFKPGEGVSKCYNYEVKIENPSTGRYYWLVHEMVSMQYPKAYLRPNPETGLAVGEACEGGKPPERKFRIGIWEVDENGHEEARKWMNRRHESGKCPGMMMPGREIAHTIVNLK